MQLTGTKRLKDGRQMLPAGGYSEPTENQGIMDMETGEIIALSKKDQRIADAKKNRKEIMEKLQAKVDKENAEAAKPKPDQTLDQIIASREKEVEANAAKAESMVNEINKRLPPGHYIDYNKMFSSAVDVIEGRTTIDDAVNRFTSKKPIKKRK